MSKRRTKAVFHCDDEEMNVMAVICNVGEEWECENYHALRGKKR